MRALQGPDTTGSSQGEDRGRSTEIKKYTAFGNIYGLVILTAHCTLAKDLVLLFDFNSPKIQIFSRLTSHSRTF